MSKAFGGSEMKKKMIFLIPLMIVILLIQPIFIHGDYQVTVGQTFTYTVNRSHWQVKLGDDSGSASKFVFGLNNEPEGTSLSVEVTDVVPSSYIDYNVTIGSYVYPMTADDTDLLAIQQMLYYIAFLGVIFVGPWSQAYVDMGPTTHTTIFFDTSVNPTYEFFRQFANSTFLTSFFSNTAFGFSQMEGNFDESGANAIFDWIIVGSIDNLYTAFPFVVDGYLLFKVAFDKTTGVEQGYRLELDYSGTNDGRDFEIYLIQEVTLDGYNLPDFYFDNPGGAIPGFEWFVSIFALNTIVITSVIIRKRKKY
jgi:hypothetical protein